MMVTDKMSYRPIGPIVPIIPIIPILPIFPILTGIIFNTRAVGCVWRGGVRFFMGALTLDGSDRGASLDRVDEARVS